MQTEYRDFYEQKALSYRDQDPAARLRYEKAVGLAQLGDGATILDIACKDAMLVDLLAQRSARVGYTGVDIAEKVLEKNRGRYPDKRFVQADVMDGLPFEDGTFDAVFALEILEHVPHPHRLLSEARRVLKPDGRLLVSVPNPYYYMEIVNELRGHPDTEGHLFAFGDANIKALLKLTGLEVVARVGTYLLIPKRLRGAFRSQAYWIISRVPSLLARSRIYCCKRA